MGQVNVCCHKEGMTSEESAIKTLTSPLSAKKRSTQRIKSEPLSFMAEQTLASSGGVDTIKDTSTIAGSDNGQILASKLDIKEQSNERFQTIPESEHENAVSGRPSTTLDMDGSPGQKSLQTIYSSPKGKQSMQSDIDMQEEIEDKFDSSQDLPGAQKDFKKLSSNLKRYSFGQQRKNNMKSKESVLSSIASMNSDGAQVVDDLASSSGMESENEISKEKQPRKASTNNGMIFSANQSKQELNSDLSTSQRAGNVIDLLSDEDSQNQYSNSNMGIKLARVQVLKTESSDTALQKNGKKAQVVNDLSSRDDQSDANSSLQNQKIQMDLESPRGNLSHHSNDKLQVKKNKSTRKTII